MRLLHSPLVFVFIFCVGLTARWCFIQLPGNYDQASYRIVADIMANHGNIYAETTRYNYSPLWAFFLQGMAAIAVRIDTSLEVVVRCILSVIDCLNALLLGAIFRRRLVSFLYLLNPVAILLVGYHGQFETLAAFPLLLAILLILTKPRLIWLFWLLATFTLLIKHIFLFHLWVAFVAVAKTWRGATLFMVLSLFVWLASFLPYLPEGFGGIVQNVLLYRGIPGMYGLSSFIPSPFGLAIFLLVLAGLPFLFSKNVVLAHRLSICGILLLTLIPGIGIHYLLIPLLFGAVSAGYLWYTGWCTLLLLTSPNNIHIVSLPPLWNYAWIGALGWAVYLCLPYIAQVRAKFS
jgi:hypothetical protein